MTAQALLDLSPLGEQAALALALVLLGALAVRAWARPTGGARAAAWESALGRRRELGLLLLVVTVATAARTVGIDRPLTAPYWFSQTATLNIANLLAQDAWWTYFHRLLRTYQMGVLEGSAAMMPVAVGFQWLLGPSFWLPSLIGAVVGTTAVVLGWWLGRVTESRAFGLVFAALLAVSPLQIVWSRHGGIWIGAVPHVLLVLGLSHLAGARGSPLLAALAGVAVWVTLYQYSAVRVAIPLGLAAFALGAVSAGTRASRAVAALGVLLATLVAIYAVARPPGLTAVLWPRFPGYVGNVGEQTPAELVGHAIASIRRELPKTLSAYFWTLRASTRVGGWAHPSYPSMSVLTWGMEAGGLALAPVGLLGVLGIGRCLVAPRRRGLWVLLAAAALMPTLLSATTARRLLLFDTAWCALAAHGVLALRDAWPLRALSARAAGWTTGVGLLGLGAWSFATIVLLNGVLPPNSASNIPFGESGYGDGRTCLGCLKAATRWRDDIARGRFVVLFDTDAYRENRTMPGGLPLYGKIAALSEGRSDRFLSFYAVWAGYDPEPPTPGAIRRSGDFATYLSRQVENADPTAIVWAFAQPTLWERWLADRLEAAGGRRERLPATPLALPLGQERPAMADPAPENEAFRIVTPREQRDEALAIVHALAAAARPPAEACATLAPETANGPPGVIAVAGAPADDTAPPAWVVFDLGRIRLGAYARPAASTVALAYQGKPTETIHALDRFGGHTIIEPRSGHARVEQFPLRRPLGLGCAAFVMDRWWTVDPLSGSTLALPPAPTALPRGAWIGIAAWSDREVALASVEQRIHVVDVTSGRETLRFPAAVWPSRRLALGECSLLAVGDGWIGSLNHLSGTLDLYDRSGAPLGTLRPKWPNAAGAMAIGASGSYLAFGAWEPLRVARVVVDADCRRRRAQRRRLTAP